MPNSSSIELRTVDRLTPFTLQLARSGLQALLRNGNPVEARVIAMLGKDVAQLEILGQKVEVSTPQALEAGTTISVAINRNGQSLELVIRPDTNASRPQPGPQAASGSGRGYGVLAEIIGSLQSVAASIDDRVLAAQAAINEAVLSSEANIQSGNLPSAQPSLNAVMQAYSAAASPPEAQLQAEGRARYDLDVKPASHPAGDYVLSSSSYKAPQLTPQSALLPPVPGQHSSNYAPAMLVPFQIPQMLHPILMHIQQDDENKSRKAPLSPAAKRWTVNFSLDTGTIGSVHVSMGLSASALSVRLSSDETESASLLSAWLPELKAILEEADFAVEDLSVHEVSHSDTANNAPALL